MSTKIPTAEEINALDEPLRRYIHDLETRCDPSGEVRELAVAKETVAALEAQVVELGALLDERDQKFEEAGRRAFEAHATIHGRLERAQHQTAKLEEALRGVLRDLDNLMASSQGVAGWHLNGSVAGWGELGLESIDAASDLLAELSNSESSAETEDEEW